MCLRVNNIGATRTEAMELKDGGWYDVMDDEKG